MRQIKFRGLSTKDNCWVYGLLHYNAVECCLQITEYVEIQPCQSEPAGGQYNIFHNIKEGTESQFTGLLDKNGIEIYERDIIKCPQTKFYLGIEVWKVEYSEIWGSYGWTDGGAWYQFKQDFDYEVIGNIYENPELLNH